MGCFQLHNHNGLFVFMAPVPSCACGFRATDVMLLGAPSCSSGALHSPPISAWDGTYRVSPLAALRCCWPCRSCGTAGMLPTIALPHSQGGRVPFSLSKSSNHTQSFSITEQNCWELQVLLMRTCHNHGKCSFFFSQKKTLLIKSIFSGKFSNGEKLVIHFFKRQKTRGNILCRKKTNFHGKKCTILVSAGEDHAALFPSCIRPVCLRC